MRVDALIVTALPIELQGVMGVSAGAAEGSSWTQQRVGGYPLWTRLFTSVAGGSLLVGATHAPFYGGDYMAATCSALVERTRPRLVIMSGICAGRPGTTRLGDVVIADTVWRYDLGKHRGYTFERDTRMSPVAREVSFAAIALSGFEDVVKLHPRPDDDAAWHVHVAPMAAGSGVREDSEIWEQLSVVTRKIAALEMECSAVAASADVARVPWLIAKSVVDHAEPPKDDRFHAFGARVSAEVALLIARTMDLAALPPIAEPIGTTSTVATLAVSTPIQEQPVLLSEEDIAAAVASPCSIVNIHVNPDDFVGLRAAVRSWIATPGRHAFFALATISMQAAAGFLMGDKVEVDLYRKSRSPLRWRWADTGPTSFREVDPVLRAAPPKRVALLLSVSGSVDREAVALAMGGEVDYDIVEVAVTDPNREWLQSRNQLDEWREAYAKALDGIYNRNGPHVDLHIFAAIPTAIGAEVGRRLQPGLGDSLIVYEMTNGVYRQGVDLRQLPSL